MQLRKHNGMKWEIVREKENCSTDLKHEETRLAEKKWVPQTTEACRGQTGTQGSRGGKRISGASCPEDRMDRNRPKSALISVILSDISRQSSPTKDQI